MFEVKHLKGNTYYLQCFSNIGIYYLGNGEVILIDAGDHKKSVTDLYNFLEEKSWRVKAIFNTHSHLDHIAGNRFFKDKYGCKAYASEMEQFYGVYPQIDVAEIFMSVPVKINQSSMLNNPGTETELLTKAVLPEGFEIMPLPGHTFNMVAIMTPDNVWFLGDAVLAKMTYEGYKIPFFFDINKSIETCEMLAEMKASFFVPSHDTPYENDIRELALYNAEKLRQIKEYIFSLCDGRTLEGILQKADEDMKLNYNLEKYARVLFTVRAFLQSLISDGRINADIKDGRLVYRVEK